MTRAPATMQSEAMRRSGALTIDPDQIRAQIEGLLAGLPEIVEGENELTEGDIDEIARRLSEAHDVLVRALESAEKG